MTDPEGFAGATALRDAHTRLLLTRRDTLTALAVGSVASLTNCAALTAALPASGAAAMPSTSVSASAAGAPPALAGQHVVVPLPFAAGSLNGLSERLLSSHHENNYAGAVKNLNRVELELANVTAETAPFVVAALRDKELTFRNSKTLHEAYFGNLGGDGRRSGPIEAALAKAYGSTAVFERQFRSTGLGLSGGSGWVVLGYELETGALRVVGAGNHTQALATSVPLLVMDMYEHSYQLDFGAGAAKYIEAFFTNLQWDAVNHRLERAMRAAEALRG